MNRKFLIYSLLIGWIAGLQFVTAQNLTLAKSYLKDGEYEKAYPIFMQWYQKRNFRYDVYQAILKIYFYKGDFNKARRFATEAYDRYKNAVFLVDAYHASIRDGDSLSARKTLKQLDQLLQTRRADFLPVARKFKNYGYYNQALDILSRYVTLNPGIAYLDMAEIYAEQGQLQPMMETFIQAAESKPFYFRYVTANLSKYITTNPANRYNRQLKTVLIRKITNNPQPVYLKLLQWLYVRENNFKQAFIQAKGLYLRGKTGKNDLFYLAQEAFDNRNYLTARQILDFLKQEAQNNQSETGERIKVLETRIERELNRNNPQKLNELIPQWKKRATTIQNLQLRQQINREIAETFLQLKQYPKAYQFLDSLIRTTSAGKYIARWKEMQGDILLLQKQFDRAAIQFTLLKEENPYTETGYRAVYKTGLASFLEGDFDWAHRTLKTLKKAADRNIANDALLLDFIIISNRKPGDTIQAGLKAFSKLYFEFFARNYRKLIRQADSLKSVFKNQKIYDDILYLQAVAAEKTAQYQLAVNYWNEILTYPTEKTLREEALYHLGTIFADYLKDYSKARDYFKRILLDYPQGFRHDQAAEYYEKLKTPEL